MKAWHFSMPTQPLALVDIPEPVPGQLAPAINLISFDEIPAGLERLRRGEVEGHLVAHVS